MGKILILVAGGLLLAEVAAALADPPPAPAHAPQVEVTLVEGGRPVRFRLPLPAEEEFAQAELYEGPFAAAAYPRYRVVAQVRVQVRKSGSGQSRLHYDVERRAVQEGGGAARDVIMLVEAHGALMLPQSGPVIVCERIPSREGPTSVQVEVK